MIDYSEDWLFLLIFKLKGSVMVRASLFAVPAMCFSIFLVIIDDFAPDFRKDFGFLDASKSQLWSATTGVLAILLGFRTNRAMSRFWEGTGLLHQMRGEWFDSVSCCVTFSRAAADKMPEEVKNFRHTIVRLMSLCHGSALEEIAGESSNAITAIDSYGLDNATLRHLKECKEKHGFNRVEVLLHLTQSIITKAHDDNILKIPPPILSRVYQTLSRGFVNLLNAKKIADTRFPFPYAQIISMLLLTHVVITPVMISSLMQHKVMCPIFTFVPIFGMFYVNFVGVELENPFGDDDNDLPLDHFQSEMNNCLLMLLQENADLISTVDPKRCTMSFDTLKESLQQAHEGSIPLRADINHRRISQFSWSYDPDILESESETSETFAKDIGHEVGPMNSMKTLTSMTVFESSRAQQLLDTPGPALAALAEEVKAPSSHPPILGAAPVQQRTAEQQLEASMFSGAIGSFLEASQPVVLTGGRTNSSPGRTSSSPGSAPPRQELLQPPSDLSHSGPNIRPLIFVPAPPSGDRGHEDGSPQTPQLTDSARTAIPSIVPKTKTGALAAMQQRDLRYDMAGDDGVAGVACSFDTTSS